MSDKSNIAVICIFGMITGFLISNATLSISTFLFGVNALYDVNPKQWFRNKWWLIGVGWVACYAITYFWSVDTANWGRGLQIKLPILLLPLAFAYTPRFSGRQLRAITLFTGLLLLGGVCYSLSFLVNDPDHFMFQYRISHLLPTPCKKDHVRFSLFIALYILWCVYNWPILQTKAVKWVTGIIMGILVLYLHILAAKTGLISLYLFLTGYSLYLLFIKKKLAGIIIIIAIPLVIIFATNYIPTFGMRKGYIVYSWYMLITGDKSGNYGDIGRLFSYDIAIKYIKEHPLAGVGGGDVMAQMKKGYDLWYPQIADADRLVPHNQFLMQALGCGIPAMLLFAVWVFMPLARLRKNRQSFFFFMVWLLLFIQLMIEPVLEVQNGVFVFMFFLLLQMKQLPEEGTQS